MKKLIVFVVVCITLASFVWAEDGTDYVGVNLCYSSSKLNYNDMKGTGFGGEVTYNSFVVKEVLFSINGGFFYRPYIVDRNDTVDVGWGPTNLQYTSDEKFYDIKLGFTFSYVFRLTEHFFRSSSKFLKNTFPYLGAGVSYSFIYHSISNSYDPSLSPSIKAFIDTNDRSYWFPAIASIPLIFGIKFQVSNNMMLDLGGKYSIMLYDDVTKSNGFNNILDFSLGAMLKL